MSTPGAPARADYVGAVLDTGGESVGTCFQLAPRLLVTAHHVLDALGVDFEQPWAQVAWFGDGRPRPVRLLRVSTADDLAVLAADEPWPVAAPGLAAADALPLHTPLGVAGVPEIHDPGHAYAQLHGTGFWQGTVMRDGAPVGRIECASVVPGMSGAPVFRLDDGFVVGLVSARFHSSDEWLHHTVWVARSEAIAALLGGIRDVTVHGMAQPTHDVVRAPRPEQRCPVVGLPVVYGLTGFRDRRRHLAVLGRRLADERTRLVTIIGRRGIGKSALAARVLKDIAEGRWPGAVPPGRVGGIVYESARTCGISLERVFLDCARLLPGPREAQAIQTWTSHLSDADKLDRLLSELTQGPYFLLLDNVEDHLTDAGEIADEGLATLFDVALRHSADLRIVVTSQIALALRPELLRFDQRIALTDGLPTADAVSLLRELDPNGEAELRDAADSALASAVQRVHGVPRAIELIAGAMLGDYLALPTLDELLASFSRRGDVIANLAQDRLRRLEGPAHLVINILAVFRRPVARQAVQAVASLIDPEVDASSGLAVLARGHLVGLDRVTRAYALHPMDADFAYSALPTDGRRALELAVAEYYRSLRIPGDVWETLEDVDPARSEYWHRVRGGDFDGAVSVLAALDEFLVWHGSVGAVLEMHEALAGAPIAAELAAAHTLGHGLARMAAGPLDAAVVLLQSAQQGATTAGDRLLTGRALLMLSTAYREMRRLLDSITSAQAAAQIFAELGETTRRLHALLSLSLSYSYSGSPDLAMSVCHDMKPLIEATDDTEGRARMLDALCLAQFLSGDLAAAITTAKETYLWYERAGLPYEVGYGRNVQGMAHLMRGELEQAAELFLQGREDGRMVHTPRVEAICLYNLAWAHWLQGDLSSAVDAARESVQAADKAGNADLGPATAMARATEAIRDGRHEDALRSLLEAARLGQGNADLIPVPVLTGYVALSAADLGLTELESSARVALEQGTGSPDP